MADDKNVATPPNVGSVALMFLTVRRILSQRNRLSRSCSLRGDVRRKWPDRHHPSGEVGNVLQTLSPYLGAGVGHV